MITFLSLGLVSLFWVSLVGAQGFSVPSGWRKPTSRLSRVERANLAQAAIDALTPLINPSSGTIDGLGHSQSASLISVLALHDTYSGNNTNEDTASNNLQIFLRNNPDFYASPIWGLAAYYTYRAYKQQFLLDIATSVWDHASQYQITPAQAANGSHPQRTVTFPSSCNGSTNAGAVFWQVSNTTNLGTNGETMGPFLALSAYLYEATLDSKYSVAAELSAKYIETHLYNGTIITDAFNVGTCVSPANDAVLTYNSGFAIEGFSVWANITKSSEWNAFTDNLVASTIKFSGWTGNDGINFEEAGTPTNPDIDNFASGLKALFVRGLHEAWARSDNSSGRATLISSYITVQMNALLNLATAPGSNNYSSNWIGPPVTVVHPWGQIAALDVLNPSFDILVNPANSSSSGNSSSTSTSTGGSSSSASSSSSNTGAIVGGVVGGVAGLALIVGAVFFFLRLRRYERRNAPILDMAQRDAGGGTLFFGHTETSHLVHPSVTAIEPFTQPSNDPKYVTLAGTRAGPGKRQQAWNGSQVNVQPYTPQDQSPSSSSSPMSPPVPEARASTLAPEDPASSDQHGARVERAARRGSAAAVRRLMWLGVTCLYFFAVGS
ncbi:hypothetical protein OF83DRAFT_1267414, partial [Amylostereum chailletii]